MTINQWLALPSNKGYSAFGAQMGRHNQPMGSACTLEIEQIEFEDGDYDLGGAYWGGNTPLYCAHSLNDESGVNDEPIIIFVRASNMKELLKKVDAELKEDGFRFTYKGKEVKL